MKIPRIVIVIAVMCLLTLMVVMIAEDLPQEWYQPLRHFLRELWRFLT